MNKYKIALVILFALSLQSQWLAQAEESIPVTAEQLLRTPGAFVGKEISVIGYYSNSKRGSCLFVDCRAAKNSRPHRQSIWIDETTFNPGNPPSPPIGISELCDLKEHYVRIMGHFHYRGGFNRGFGLGGLWPSEIAGVVNFRVARKTPDDPVNPCGIYKRNRKDKTPVFQGIKKPCR